MHTTYSAKEIQTALAVAEAFDSAEDAGGDGLAVAATVARNHGSDASVTDLLTLGAQLIQARDYALPELAQYALGITADDVATDLAAAYHRVAAMPAALDKWVPEAASDTTRQAVRAMLTYLTTEPDGSSDPEVYTAEIQARTPAGSPAKLLVRSDGDGIGIKVDRYDDGNELDFTPHGVDELVRALTEARAHTVRLAAR